MPAQGISEPLQIGLLENIARLLSLIRLEDLEFR